MRNMLDKFGGVFCEIIFSKKRWWGKVVGLRVR